MFVAGLVLAAGQSTRLGRPKQLLPYGRATLLDSTIGTARACGFDQLIVAVGAAGEEIRAVVDLTGCTVVENVQPAEGCSSSIAVALHEIDRRADGLVLLLGDQPRVEPSAVAGLVDAARDAPEAPAVCRYDDGRGHPFWFPKAMFAELASLHGDKAVWKLLESGRRPVVEHRVRGPIPLDVDTWDDYERLVESAP